MPVNTAITLLPATPTRLQFADGDGDGASSFQDTLQRATSPQDDLSQAADDSSNRSGSSTAKADDSSKTRTTGGAKTAGRAKGKRTTSDDEPHEADAVHTDRSKVRVEAVKDAADDSDAKQSAKSKTKPAVATANQKSADPSSAVAHPSPVVEAEHTAEVDTDTDEPAKTAARATADAGGHTTVKKASTDGGDDSDRAEATDAEPADSDVEPDATPPAAPAGADFGAAATATAKPVRKGTTHAENAEQAADSSPAAAAAALSSTAAVAAAFSSDETEGSGAAAPHAAMAIAPTSATVTLAGASPAPAGPKTAASTAAATKALATPEAQFADTNHAKIVSSVHGQLLPGGGTMQIRLDPPELGALSVSVQMRNGAMTATFETSSPEATQLLSHSLNDLRTVLESSGVTVDKIHVQQSAKLDSQSSGGDGSSKEQAEQNPQAKQEQQRRELLQRMWKKLSGGDPLDLTA